MIQKFVLWKRMKARSFVSKLERLIQYLYISVISFILSNVLSFSLLEKDFYNVYHKGGPIYFLPS